MGYRKNVRLGASVACLAVGTIAATGTSAQEADTLKWAVPISFSSNLTALGDTLPWVAERLNTLSGGKIEFEILEPGKLIPALAVFESTATGQIEAGYSWMGYERGQVPASALFGATPFGLEPDQFVAWMYQGGGNELLLETFEPYNVHPILCGVIAPEAAGWFKFPIESVDQLSGLKFRAAGLGGEILKEVGMAVSVLPGGELYQALETGVLDGTEFSLPTVDEQLGFYQVAKYYHLPGWHQPSTSQYLYINSDVWQGLSPTTQAMIETSCMAGVTYAIARAEALQGAVLASFEENGVVATRLPDEVLQTFRDATEVVMARESEADPMFAKVYGSMKAFQASNTAWHSRGYLPRDWQWANAPAAE
ncbi:TRAP transporter substrate-binding protein [uncultured Paracoccus sp.]|uniref:TRAP transporter substrate-binding protein n=1 Tax=uncultured Paracoccus sp. TaxID=189685 RepID=UPI0026246393|nr:TRAP transporter substrate-binding protein [uncultured Paracoccus sp.]HMR36677.1 TRAP transporter substrate-binding protein [Paracoccus sp. (in: a-proteobacteria)]